MCSACKGAHYCSLECQKERFSLKNVDDADASVKYAFGTTEREVGENKVLWSLTSLGKMAIIDHDVSLVNNDYNSFHFVKVAVPLSGLFGEHQVKREEIQ